MPSLGAAFCFWRNAMLTLLSLSVVAAAFVRLVMPDENTFFWARTDREWGYTTKPRRC
jgi:hypothetical protein